MSDEKDKEKERLAEGTLISHLLELRDRLLKAVVAVVVFFIPAFFLRKKLFDLLVDPLIASLPEGGSMINTTITGTFMVPFKLALFVSVFAAMPWVLYQIWAFVAPGLYKHEKRFAVPMLASSIVLFYVGVYFAYQFIVPMIFKFLLNQGLHGVAVTPEIGDVLDFMLRFFLAFGVVFEIPVVVVLLTLTGLVTVEKLSNARGYVVIGIFVVAAILTPPDMGLSQISMAVPMWLLYEGGVVMARLLNRNRGRSDDKDKSGGVA